MSQEDFRMAYSKRNAPLFKGTMEPVSQSDKLKMGVFIMIIFAISAVFQTLAWYHGVDKNSDISKGLSLTFVISMIFVVAEYIFLIPGNLYGAKYFTLFQLGIMVEFTSWIIFLLYIKYVQKENISGKEWFCVFLIFIAVLIGYW